MNKIFTKNLKLKINNFINKELFFCFFWALFLLLFFNNFETKNLSAIQSFIAYLLVYIICYSLLILLSFNHKILKLLVIILLFFSTINIYVKNQYGYILDEIMIANALDSIGHINDAIDYKLFLYFIFLTIIPSLILITHKLTKNNLGFKIISLFGSILLSLILIFIIPKNIPIYALNAISPSSFITSSYRYYKRFSVARKITKNRQTLNNFYNFNYNSKKYINDDFKIVIVIGESLRADHLQLFGYNRQTTPNLVTKKNLLKFQSQAFYTVTTPAITDLLSHRLNNEFMDIPPEKSIVDLMKNLGFKTHWFSMQSSKQFGTEMLNIMAMEADEYFFRDRIRIDLPDRDKLYDDDLMPYFSKVIDNKQRSFIILHTFGSHIHFFERYPSEFKKFSDECGKNLKSCSSDQIINSYDNSVYFTDFFLNQVIEKIDQSNAILFYISDHGSFLGEGGIFANGSLESSQDKAHNVPMFIYFSKKIQENNNFKQKIINAKNNQKNLLNPDYFFDSVLDCSAIESNLINTRKLSVCNKI